MKIAQVVCTFPPYQGGIGNSAYQFAKILTKLGHDITIFTPEYFKTTFIPAEQERFKIIRIKPWFKFGNGALSPQLLWKLNNFDIIHFHYPFYGAAEFIVLGKLLFNRKINIVVHYHMDSAAIGIKGFIFNLYRVFVQPILLRQAKIITCASLDYIKHCRIANYYKNNQNKFRQTLFGVDLEFFTPKNKIKSNKKIILFVGGLDKAHYFKGLENLLKAVKVLSGELSDEINFNVVGKGNLELYYKKLAEKLGIENKVNFSGSLDNEQLVDYYNNCNVVVLPSINQGEAFGLVLLEAMACAKPVVASNLPGVRSVFKNGEQGFLVKPNDVNDSVKKLKIILQDEDLAYKMGQAGRKLAEERYSWEKVGERLNLIYHYVNYTPK